MVAHSRSIVVHCGRGRPHCSCSANSLMIDARDEGATRCRDTSNEVFANRASSRVASVAAPIVSGTEDVAGDKGRFVGSDGVEREKLLVEDGPGKGIETAPRILDMFCHACSSSLIRARSSTFSCNRTASVNVEEPGVDKEDRSAVRRKERFSSSSPANLCASCSNWAFFLSREDCAARRLR